MKNTRVHVAALLQAHSVLIALEVLHEDTM